uniref:PA domain-containing protein n=1 Tax=Fodinicola feengrottensis TaxID=435914 RepID=UPI0013D07BE7
MTTRPRSPAVSDLTVGSLTVHPHYITEDGGNDVNIPVPVKMFDGRRRTDVVYVAGGSDADFAGKDVRGRLVLAQVQTAAGLTSPIVDRANKAGAAGVVVFDSASMTQTSTDDHPELLPVTYLSRPDGLKLLGQLSGGRGSAQLRGTPVSPYAYHFAATGMQGIPDGLKLRVDPARMVKVTTSYHSTRDLVISSGTVVDDLPPLPSGDLLRAPSQRADYYGPVKAGPVWGGFMEAFEDGNLTLLSSAPEQLTRPLTRSDDFNAAPKRAGQGAAYRLLPLDAQPLSLSRNANTLYYTPEVLDGNNHLDLAGPLAGEMTVKLSKDGTVLPGTVGTSSVGWPVPAGSGRYRFDVGYAPVAFAPAGYRSDTTWEFTSAPPAAPWTRPGYVCGDADNPATASQPCAAQPAIMLDYDLGTSPGQTVTAPGGGARSSCGHTRCPAPAVRRSPESPQRFRTTVGKPGARSRLPRCRTGSGSA